MNGIWIGTRASVGITLDDRGARRVHLQACRRTIPTTPSRLRAGWLRAPHYRDHRHPGRRCPPRFLIRGLRVASLFVQARNRPWEQLVLGLNRTMMHGLSQWQPKTALQSGGRLSPCAACRTTRRCRSWPCWTASSVRTGSVCIGGRWSGSLCVIPEKNAAGRRASCWRGAHTLIRDGSTCVVFQFVSVDFTKLFHELVRSLFELVHYCRRELGPGKGPVEPYVSVKLATVTLSCSSELIHKIPRPCIGII